MATHNLTIPLLVGNGVPVSEVESIVSDAPINVQVEIGPAYQFQREDGAVNWQVPRTFTTNTASITIPGLEDTDTNGADVIWQMKVRFIARGDKYRGGDSVLFKFADAAPTDAAYPDDVVLQDVVENPEYGPTWAVQAEAAAVAAQQAQVAAQGYAAAAQAVPLSNDGIIAGRINTPGSATATALSAAIGTSQAKGWARTPDVMFSGAVTHDGAGAPTAANVIWPDGATGVYTADTISALFPPAVDAYHVTRVSSAGTQTFTQPLVTRDAYGNVANQPDVTVA